MAEGTRIDLTPMAERLRAQMSGDEMWKQPAPLAAPTAMFGPGEAVMPVWPEERPRVFEYQPGVNLVSVPRAGYGLASFATLRNLAAGCKEVRLNVELIKRQMRGLKWDITPVRERDKLAGTYAGDIAEAKEWLETPDGYHDFDAWTNQLLEEMLTIDAVTMWADGEGRSIEERNASPLRLELIDGATIRPLLDVWGRVPAPPLPAYIQMLHGAPTSYYSRERLIYAPLNASVRSPYGTSPVEWILLTVNLAMRRDVNHVAAFTEGNVPEALVGAPASWTQLQINTWQQYWDALTAGNVTQLRRMHWVPVEGASGIPVYEFHKDDLGNTERDKWLMQVACWAFGNSPAEFGLAPGEGLGGKGYGQAMEGAQYRSMLWPAAEYMASLLTGIIQKRLGKRDLRFIWLDLEPKEDKLTQAQVDQIYVGMGIYSAGYVQDRDGVPEEFRPDLSPGPFPEGKGGVGGEYEATVAAVEIPAAEMPAALTPSPSPKDGRGGYEARVEAVAAPVTAPAALSEAAQKDLRLWRQKAMRRGGAVGFKSEHIPEGLMKRVGEALAKAQGAEEIRRAFDEVLAAGGGRSEGFFRYP